MSDTDTPRTDAALEYPHCSCDACDGTLYMPAEDARQLERELAACREALEKAEAAAESAKTCYRLAAELDRLAGKEEG